MCYLRSGLCKDLMLTLTQHGYLVKADFALMQRQQDRVHLPREIGAVPRKIGSSFNHIKADQVILGGCASHFCVCSDVYIFFLLLSFFYSGKRYLRFFYRLCCSKHLTPIL